MKIPKWFEEWFNLPDTMGYKAPDWWEFAMRNLVWRAYRKGLREGRKLSNEQLASAEHKGNMKGFKRGRNYGVDE